MFGFLRPTPASRAYRRCYARLCQFQHLHYGVGSLPFHSYEATFLFAAGRDAGAFPRESLPDRTCCKLMTRRGIQRGPDAEVGRFCASFALLLASIKLQDDIRDSHGLVARLARWILRRRLDEANRYFARLDSRFAANVGQLIRDHHDLEARNASVDLDAYTVPTSQAFGYLFGLMSRLNGMESHRQSLIRLGREIGSALILFDCATDYHRDRRQGEFNPLSGEEAIDEAFHRSAAHLEAASRIDSQAFGESALTVSILESVARRVRGRSCCETRPDASPWQVVGSQIRSSTRKWVPVLASSSNGKHDQPPDEPELPKLTEEEKKRMEEEQRQRRRASGSDCCDGCLCFGYSCQCLGDGCQILSCCEGAECCAVCG